MARQFGIITTTTGISGIVVNSFSRNKTAEIAEARNEKGEVTDLKAYSKGETISVTGLLDAESITIEPGSKLTLGEKDYIIESVDLNSSQVVERNNYGEELTESSTVDSYVTMAVNHEKLLTSWTKDSEVEQTIGVPFLCEVPVLKYIFGYTTKNIDKTHFFLTVTAEFVHPDADIAELSGRMTSLTDLVPAKK